MLPNWQLTGIGKPREKENKRPAKKKAGRKEDGNEAGVDRMPRHDKQ